MTDQRKNLRRIGAYLVCVGLLSSLYGGSVLAEENEENEELEEVIVTGSYLPGSAEDAPSPVKVIGREQFDEEGAFTLFDVVRNLTVNSGSLGNNESGGVGVSNDLVGTQNVNLRGLGPNSTLVLINGKRLAPVAAQTTSGGEVVDTGTIPSIMTERVEILLDGGSALYGSDAVAGVFNIIMRNNFEGLEIETQAGGMTEAIEDGNKRIAGIWGWGSADDKTNFVLSGEYYHQDEVGVSKANFFDPSLQQFIGHVGSIITPIMGFDGEQLNPDWLNQEIVDQAIAEGGPGGARLTDPLCQTLTTTGGDPFFVGHQWAGIGYPSSQCYEDTRDLRQITTEYERSSIAGNFSHVFNDHLELYSFFNFADAEAVWASDGITYSPYATYNLAQPGAFGGAILASGLELGYFAPYVVREGREPLAAPTYIPNHPGAGYNGGPNISVINNQTVGFPRTRSDKQSNQQKATTVQMGLRGDFEFANRTLDYDIGLSWSENSLEATGLHFNRERTELAANGLGGPNCVPNGVDDFDFQTLRYAWGGWNAYDYLGFVTTGSSAENVNNLHQSMSLALTSNNQGVGDCQFLNPYLSSLTNPELANSDELLDWIREDVMLTDKRNKVAVFDAVIFGELFEMAGGTAQFAAGVQHRRENRDSNAASLLDPVGRGLSNWAIKSFNDDGPIYNDEGVMIRESGTVAETHDFISNSLTCDRCSYTFDLERTVSSVFLELSLPVWKKFESQIAVRYEDYGGSIGGNVTPKIAVSYKPMDTLLLRGSFSQSFRAPNVGVVHNGLESFGAYVQDPLRAQAVRAGILPPTEENYRGQGAYFVGAPSPDLTPEEADTYSIGLQWVPDEFLGVNLRGFDFGATYWRFEYSDRVGRQPANEAFNVEVEAFLIAAADPDNYILNSTQQPYGVALTDYKTKCDPIALSAEHGDGLPDYPLADIAFPLATTPNPASPNIDDFPRLDCIVDPATYLVDTVQRATGTEATRAAIRSVSAISINAGEIVTDGLDIEWNYDFNTDLGLFGVGMEYTHVNQYTFKDIPGLENGFYGTGIFDAAGTTGGEGLVRSLPDNRGHIRLWWYGEKNSVTIFNRHIGSYRDLVADFVREANNAETAARVRDTVPSYNSWDFHYQYRHSFNGEKLDAVIISVNVMDVFNSPLPFRETGSSGLRYDGQAPIDPRGRRANIVARVIF